MKFRIPFTNRHLEIRSSLANPQEWLLSMLNRGYESKAGVNVSANDALKLSAVYACVKVISETLAYLNCNLYKRKGEGKEIADSHDLYGLLHYLPNPETTAFEFWQMYLVNLLLTGDAFAYVKRDKNGKILELWNIPSKNVTIYRNINTKELYYKVQVENEKEVVYYPENIMRTVGMRFNDKDLAINTIQIARDALGLSMALEEYGSKYFANGASVGGIVEYPTALSDAAFSRFKEDFQKNYSGVANSNKILFLEDGGKFTKISNSPAESQTIEARRFQLLEVCRYFNVPPHMVMDLERATFSNIEEQQINFVTSCLAPICVRLEQTIFKDLLNIGERRKYFAKFNVNALMRGNTAARKDYYNTMIQNGIMNANEVRALEDMNAYEGGDQYLINGNMIPVNKIEEAYEKKMNPPASNGGGDMNDGKGNKDDNNDTGNKV